MFSSLAHGKSSGFHHAALHAAKTRQAPVAIALPITCLSPGRTDIAIFGPPDSDVLECSQLPSLPGLLASTPALAGLEPKSCVC